jgi:hypothetical protein
MGTVPDYKMLYFTADLVPCCARCGRVRDDAGRWHELDPLPADMDAARLTHTICPECLKALYPAYLKRKRRQPAPD